MVFVTTLLIGSGHSHTCDEIWSKTKQLQTVAVDAV